MPSHFGQYGLLAEFADADTLVAAAREIHGHGYRDVEAYSPYPVEGLADALGFTKTRMPLVVLLGGITGGVLGYSLQYWTTVVDYPLNVGGRPLHSWPSFMPVTFETTVLVAALSAVLGMLALNGLPRPHHPLFSVEQFGRATQDKFFLCIRATDLLFDANATRQLLEKLSAEEVNDVPK